MKRAIDFELLAQLAGKERDSQGSDSSGLCILVERDLARLPDMHTASKDVDADRAPVMEKSRPKSGI
jgi:hypothetical protein